MKKRFGLGTVLALMLLVASVTFLIALQFSIHSLNSQLSLIKEQEEVSQKLFQVRQIVEENFVGEYDSEKLLDGAIAGMIESLGDKWSRYLDSEQFETYMQDDTKVVGIGVTVSLDAETGYLLVTEVYNNSPAAEAGVVAMDVLVRIEGEDVSDLGYYNAVEKVKGDEYSTVSLTFLRGTETYTVELRRRTVAIEMVKSEILNGNIGYIRVRGFETHVDVDFSEALLQLQSVNAKGLIIDMRNNPGGNRDVLLPMLDLLLPDQAVMMITETKDGTSVTYRSDENCYEFPVVVLVDSSSYSAAEFFAACLQEHGRAVIVGEPTTGKGYAQVAIPLSDGSGLVLSTLEYFTPSGKSLANVGLQPDFAVEITPKERQSLFALSHEDDRQLQKALELLAVG